jgi:hypothetical protein
MPTLENMRSHGVRHVLIFCANAPRCWHKGRMNIERLPEGTTFDSIERRLVCTECGLIGGTIRPDWSDRPNLDMPAGISR